MTATLMDEGMGDDWKRSGGVSRGLSSLRQTTGKVHWSLMQIQGETL
jgi:hypothetical protein